MQFEVEGVKESLNPFHFINWMRDQTADAGANVRYAWSLDLPRVPFLPPHPGKLIVVGGSPSVKGYLDEIRRLANEDDSALFALNWTHNWLIDNAVVPDGCVMYEIDVDPNQILDRPHPQVTYYICSLCHPTTFDQLKDYDRLLWHASEHPYKISKALRECFPNEMLIGGGPTTFSRTISLGIVLGFREFEVFGCDSSFPDDAPSSHMEGYPINIPLSKAVDIFVTSKVDNNVRRFKTLPYLAIQASHFYEYCHRYHSVFKLRFHGDGMLPYMHRTDFPEQYAATDDARP